MEVPLLLLVLGLFVAVRTLFLVRARRTALRRPAVRLLSRPSPSPRSSPSAGTGRRSRADAGERRAA